ETDAAIIGITHFSKGSHAANPVDRVIGSRAYAALARLVMVAAKSEDNTRHVLVRAKSNIGPDTDGFVYGLARDERERQYVTWGEPIQGTARSLVGELLPEKRPVGRPSKRAECGVWLRGALLDAGEEGIPVSRILAM